MKKVMSLVVFVLSLCLITGCGKSANTITCTQKEDDMEIKTVATLDDNDKVVKVKVETKATAPSKEELDTGVAMFKLMGAMFDEVDGASFDVKTSGLTATITINVDLNKISKEQREQLNMDEYETTGKEFKKAMEDEGATCK